MTPDPLSPEPPIAPRSTPISPAIPPLLFAADVFHLLQGNWHLERTIPGHATMHGQATIIPLTPEPLSCLPPETLSSRPEAAPRPQRRDLHHPATDPKVLLYTEQVEIKTTTGHHLTGTAHYRFTHHPDNTIDVHLSTGVLFHTLTFTLNSDALEAHATHQCAADTYISTYRILSSAHLTIEHHVTGPRKRYTVKTTLTRTETPN